MTGADDYDDAVPSFMASIDEDDEPDSVEQPRQKSWKWVYPCVQQLYHVAEHAALPLSNREALLNVVALRYLARKYKTLGMTQIKLWGKVLGSTANYYIAEASFVDTSPIWEQLELMTEQVRTVSYSTGNVTNAQTITLKVMKLHHF